MSSSSKIKGKPPPTVKYTVRTTSEGHVQFSLCSTFDKPGMFAIDLTGKTNEKYGYPPVIKEDVDRLQRGVREGISTMMEVQASTPMVPPIPFVVPPQFFVVPPSVVPPFVVQHNPPQE